MDISVVSGTYNRLHSLQRMVESVRQSFGGLFGLAYEVVLVDGGSQDGTQEWCKTQPDIHLIEHGELRGAVKAFNDGAFASQGEYVVLANDDIEFLGESILIAWLYMQANLDCGMGCFYQDRNGRDWHIEEMPCQEDGRQVHRPYGQVCIVPKWLGDWAGWWGNYLHTYGGDNELSAKIYETGYKVSPIPGAKIHDREIADDLRKINNLSGASDPRAVRGHHPDSWAWGRHWRNHQTGLVGPVIPRSGPIFPNPLKAKERVVYLPIFEQGWTVQKEQKRGLREALAKVALVAEYDYVGEFSRVGKELTLAQLRMLCYRLNPTLFLAQIHNGSILNGGDIRSLRMSFPNTKFVNWNGDYWPDNLLSEDGISLARAFDLQLTVNRDALEKYQAMGVKADYWQIGWEPDGVGQPATAQHDVVFLANGYTQVRKELVKKLRGLGVDFGLYGNGWPTDWTKGQTTYDFKAGCGIYRGSKIAIGDSQWPESGFVSNRVFQALAAGGAALAYEWFKGMGELGLIDGETCLIWRTFPELEQKIRYYLAHEGERARIAQAGQAMCLERHSFDARVKELFGLIGEKETEIYWR